MDFGMICFIVLFWVVGWWTDAAIWDALSRKERNDPRGAIVIVSCICWPVFIWFHGCLLFLRELEKETR